MAWATARHILVATEEECNALKSEIENGTSFETVAQSHLVRWQLKSQQIGSWVTIMSQYISVEQINQDFRTTRATL